MAVLFDDVLSQYMEADSAPVTSYPLSMACWVMPDTNAVAQGLIWTGDKDVGNMWLGVLYLGANGAFGYNAVQAYSYAGAGFLKYAEASTYYATNVWNHVGGVWASTASRAVYLNGGGKGTETSAVDPVGTDRISLGRFGDSTPGNYASGTLAMPCIWNEALSDGEMLALANGAWPLKIRPWAVRGFWRVSHAHPGPPISYDALRVTDLTPHNGPMTYVAGPAIGRSWMWMPDTDLPARTTIGTGEMRGRFGYTVTAGTGTACLRGRFGFASSQGTQVLRGLFIVPTTSIGTASLRGRFILGTDTITQQLRGRFGYHIQITNELAGLHRIEATTDKYVLYRGVDAAVDFAADEWETFDSLPHTSAALDVSHTYYFVLRTRNNYGLESGNVDAWTVIVAADGSQTYNSPSDPDEAHIAAGAAGTALVTAAYAYGADGDDAADQWLVYLTTTGADPVPGSDDPTVVSMVKLDGVARLSWTSAEFADEADVRVIVRTRRSGASGADSTNLTVLSVVADTDGPAAPTGGRAFFGDQGEDV
ncbi:MAG TPA: LamG-like jellyroll fold domain-containing protein [Phycisphaerae bacterium]|nr:LamG-like jellyroll fold domain-containing protein [Phycisphaerae bacterium]